MVAWAQHVQRYRSLATGAEVLESRLLDCLAEYLNAEIVLRTISDVSMAIKWLTTTFLYVRVQQLHPIALLSLLKSINFFAIE